MTTRDDVYADLADQLGTSAHHLAVMVRMARLAVAAAVVVFVLLWFVPAGMRAAVGFATLGAVAMFYGRAVVEAVTALWSRHD